MSEEEFTYPFMDKQGYYWYDMSGFAGPLGPCFICNRLVDRIDIDYHGNFCNSKECNDFIAEDLEKRIAASED